LKRRSSTLLRAFVVRPGFISESESKATARSTASDRSVRPTRATSRSKAAGGWRWARQLGLPPENSRFLTGLSARFGMTSLFYCFDFSCFDSSIVASTLYCFDYEALVPIWAFAQAACDVRRSNLTRPSLKSCHSDARWKRARNLVSCAVARVRVAPAKQQVPHRAFGPVRNDIP
jgi:hypothetical protein